MAEPRKIVQGGLKAFEAASKAVDAEDAAKAALSTARGVSREADKAMEAKRLAMEAANPPIKASEAYGQHEGAYLKPIFYDRMKVDLSQGKKGGPGFSSIQLVDPNYADAKAVAGVTDQKMATRILNRNKAGVPAGAKVIWTPSVGGLEQHKSNSTMFGQFADIFASQRKNMTPEQIQKLSDRASNAVDNNGRLIFPNGIDLGARNFRQQVKTYDQRALMADIFAGRGVGGEKGRTVPVEELLEKNLDPNVAQAGTLDLGNRLFRLEGNVIDRPDLHTDYRKILTGEDLNVNYIPVPIRTVYEDWEVQKAAELAAQGKNRGVTLMDYTKNDPTIQLTEQLLTKMQKAGHKKGGPVKESEKDMAEFQKRFALHKATGGKVDIPRLSLKKADGGKIAKGLMGAINKATKAVDAEAAGAKVLPAAERDENLQKFLGHSRVRERLYHATPKNFSQFKPGGDDPTLSGPAIWLTPNAQKQPAAHNIGGGERGFKEGTNVMPVYVQARSPLLLDDKLAIEWAREVYAGGSREFPDLLSPKTIQELKKEGYDSIIHADPYGNRGGEQEIIMFEPNKIKSAIGNRGTYDINEPDITKADGGKIVKGALSALQKASAAVDAATAEANLKKMLEPSKVQQRLYHGTTATEGGKGQEAIRRIKPSKEGSLGSGVYLTPSPAHASGYSGIPNDEALSLMAGDPYAKKMADQFLADRASGTVREGQVGGNMLPVYAQIKNPLVIEGTHADPMIEALIKLGMDEDKAARMVERAYENKGYIGKEVETRARAAGYDGLMQYRNGDLSEVVSYNPNAVKSAIGNQGTYDITHPDLSKAKGGLAMAEGGDPSKRLSGNIMAGASWNSLNKTLGDQLTKATGQPTLNTAVGGATTADTYKQLMDFINSGGSFDPNATVFLQTGGVDFIKGVPKEEVKNNIEQIISTLESQGVDVVLTGAPYAASIDDVINNNFDPRIDPIFEEIAAAHPNVALVDSMGDLLQDKSLLADSLHTNETGTQMYNEDVLGALTALKQRQAPAETQSGKQESVEIPQEIERITQPTIDQEYKQQVSDPVKRDFQEAIAQEPVQAQPTIDIQPPAQPAEEQVKVPSGPDYSRAYEALGGADVVNNLRDQFLQSGLDENTIESVFSKYYPKEYQPEFAQEELKRGGAVQHDSLEDLAKFHERFALHKATGGRVNIPHLSLKRMKKFDGGGIAAADVGAGIEDKGPSRTSRIAEKLYEMAKEQGKEEISSLKKPRAITDLLNRGVLANNPVSAGVDLVNMGLGAVGLGSEKPFLGSEHIKDLMNKYGVTSGEERPLMETGLSFLSPTAVIKGAQKTADVAKKAPEMVQRATDAFTSSKLSPLATEAKTASAGKPTGATYATKQEGPFFRVRPTSLDQSTAKGRGIREADELQGTTSVGGGAGSSGSTVPTRLSDEEVARIIADPAANEPLNIAKKYTQETQGAEFTLPEIPESSLVKQSAIGRAHQLAVEGTPEYKSSVFDAYAREMPEVLEQAGAKNYDDLMEKAYRQLAKETDAQFQALPYNFSYHRAGEGNYNSSKEMAADVHGNKHLYVFQGGDPHDFLNRIDPVTGLNENEKFRAVHDLLGHAIYGNQFGPKGEEVAWAIHSQMYSPLARLAMTAETRGQNSMVNYSPLNAALKAEIAKYDSLASEARRRGDTALLNEINAAKRQAYSGFQYAPQKAVLLPPEFLDPKYAGGMPSYLEAANRPAKGTETQSVLTHFSHNPDLQFVDPKRYGTGIKGAEAERLRDFPGGVRDRSYFYMGEPGAVSPEPGLGVNRYRGEASSLYDITQDPLNFRVLARESNRTPYTAKYNQGITSPLQEANDMERLVKEYGYQGMANPKASKPMAIMFKETPVRRNARGGLTLMK